MKIIDGAFQTSIATLPGNETDKPEAARNEPLYDAAKVNPDGTPVTDVVEPYQLFVKPTAEVSALYDEKAEDFREALAAFKKDQGLPWSSIDFRAPAFDFHFRTARSEKPDCPLTRMVLPDGYEELSAVEKQSVLWKNCTETAYNTPADLADHASDPNLLIGLVVLSPLHTHTTFLHASDEMPFGRTKLIHGHGSAGTIELRVPAGSKAPFTGMFGATSVGVASDGQGDDVNYFRNTFSNIFPPPQSTGMKIVDGAFQGSIATLPGTATDKPEAARIEPLYDAAKVNPDGTPVTDVVEPYQLFFTPTAKVTALYEDVKKKDFREALATIEPAQVLWDVSAKGTSDENEKAVPIGQLVLTSKIVASSYCDDSLFFQHMRHRRPA
ncbi:hypothetical protein WJX81_001961 [Elliptochloris bilobata]|uniref:Uncharacterized protein n=1 Tax=Elliptochloris bilobata TaxID=381761 RepID=A0AAW1S0M9_9CHLO